MANKPLFWGSSTLASVTSYHTRDPRTNHFYSSRFFAASYSSLSPSLLNSFPTTSLRIGERVISQAKPDGSAR
ncbi:hypothetical protein LZ31DRAFT_556109 [Colletotrichum somersetense]|nr:hypothetical protein LZ31DRAFT_556109 [Colletotrichum somersetense]